MASDLELSDVWRELQRNGSVKTDGMLVKSCEKELIELMRQIDIMLRGKRIEWSNEKAVLNMRIESKERECALQKDSIEKRDSEIGRLKEQSSSIENNSKLLVSDYQQQVEQLKADLTSLKKHYDRLKAKYNKDKVKYSNEKRDNETEIWSRDKKLLQQEVERLSTQMISLAEKCTVLEQDKGSNSATHPLADDNVNLLRDEIYRLKCDLHESEERETERSLEIARLTSDLSHWKLKATKYAQDTQSSEAAVKRANIEINNLRKKAERLAKELRSRSEDSESLSSCKKMHEDEIYRLKDIIKDRDNTIRSLLDRNHLDESAALDALKQDLMNVDKQNREMLDREGQLTEQLANMKKNMAVLTEKLEKSSKERDALNQTLVYKEAELRDKHDHVMQAKDKEIQQLEKQLFDMRDVHSMEKTSLQAELESLKKQFAEAARVRPAPLNMVSMLSDSTIRSATSLVDADMSDHASELRITQKQLDAVRLENKHLKEQILMTCTNESSDKGNDVNLKDFEEKKAKLQLLESENEKLKYNVQAMRDELEKTRELYHRKYQAVLKDMLEDITKREQQLVVDNQQGGSKYSTPGTTESGYRSQLTIPSTGKEKLTPMTPLLSSERSREYKDRSHDISDAKDDLRKEGRKVQKMLDEDSSYIDQSYHEMTANSTCLGERSLVSVDQSASEYMIPILAKNRHSPHVSPVKFDVHEYQPPSSPTGSSRSTSTKISSKTGRDRDTPHRSSSTSLRSLAEKSTDIHNGSNPASGSYGIMSLPSYSEKQLQLSTPDVNISNGNDTDGIRLELSCDTTQDSRADTVTPFPRHTSRSSLGNQDSASKYYASSIASEKDAPSNSSVFGLLDNSNISSRPESAAEKFLSDQRQRTSVLEKLLDRHIMKFGSQRDTKPHNQ